MKPPGGVRRSRVSAEGRYEEFHAGTSTCRRVREGEGSHRNEYVPMRGL